MTDEPSQKRRRYPLDDGPQCVASISIIVLSAALDHSIASEPVLVRVGHNGEKRFVHKKLLCESSGFFQNALKGNWTESQDREVKLPLAKDDIFKIWVQWLYTGKIFLTQESDGCEITKISAGIEWTTWEECYRLGDFLRDMDFLDACIDVVIESMCAANCSPGKLPHLMNSLAPQKSGHRQLALDVFIYCRKREEEAVDGKPIGFLQDVLKHIYPKLMVPIPGRAMKEHFGSMDQCKYHNHGTEKPCYKTKPGFRF